MSTTGGDGQTDYAYSGGMHHDGRFRGFRDPVVSRTSGRRTALRYATAPIVEGDLVARSEFDRDGELEFFTYYDHLDADSGVYRIDVSAPYRNPIRRTCAFRLDEDDRENLEEDDLIETCAEWDGEPEIGRPKSWCRGTSGNRCFTR